MKKFVALLVVLATLSTVAFFNLSTFASSNVNSQKLIPVLEKMGYTKEEIATDFKDETKRKRYENIDPKKIETISTKEVYYKISYQGAMVNGRRQTQITEVPQNQALNQIQALNQMQTYDNPNNGDKEINESWIKMHMWVLGTGTNRYHFRNRFEWVTTPLYRLEDVFSLNHGGANGNISIVPGSPYYVLKYVKRDVSGNKKNIEEKKPESSKITQTGYGVVFDLPENLVKPGAIPITLIDYVDFKGYISYDAEVPKNYTGWVGMYGDYCHQETEWSVTPGFSIPPFGGSIDLESSEKYDSVNGYARFNVTKGLWK